MAKKVDIKIRFLDKVILNSNSCWDWIGATDGRYGILIVDYVEVIP